MIKRVIILNRFSFFNVRRVMDVMYNPFDKLYKQVILCLDAEKAFDQVEWPYLMRVLEKFDLGPTFISWVRMLYAQPTAAVLTNLDRSSSFPLQRGTRQGCPLSPLLFALAIEPLAISVREHSHIKPITLGGVDHKISLYADDVALFVSDPEQSIPHLLQLITSFGEVSGYTINWQKSELIPLANDLDPLFLSSTQFRIASDYVKYLGIKISKKPSALFKLNFMEKLNKLKENIEKWRTLPLSLIGRVNAIKMVSLSGFLYFRTSLFLFPSLFLSFSTPLSCPLSGGTKHIGFLKATFKNQGNVGV